MTEAVVLDLDGTLLDTLEDLATSLNTVLVARGWPAHPVAAYRRFIGDGVAKLVERAVPPAERTDAARLHAVREDFRAVYDRGWNRATRPYPGMVDAVAALARRGAALAVLSNKPHELTVPCVAHYFPGIAFAVVRGQIADGPRKPDPALARAIQPALGVAPERTAMVGDSGVDMQLARAAGWRAVGALWGFRDAAELTAAGAECLVRVPAELEAALDGLPSPAAPA
jgi:phosphoglycolate phosphatase